MRAVATTPQGPVSGIHDGGIIRYLGIPYATAPSGEGRFGPPCPAPTWSRPFEASSTGPLAPQDGAVGPTDEDCLRLHVTTPMARPEGGPRPVVVWIHGGGFTSGAAEASHTRFDRFVTGADAIAVTVGYRLGALGWLALDDLERHNAGLLDLVEALRWVRRSIASFGGDPGRVTIMGQSAGAMAGAALLAMPAARGLLHAAILQSGAADALLEHDEAAEIASWFLEVASVPRTEDLFAMSAADLLAAGRRTAARAATTWRARGRADRFLPFAPVVGPVSLPTHPLGHLLAGGGVPTIVGANTDECRISPTGRGPDEVRAWIGGLHGIDDLAVAEHYRLGAMGSDADAAQADAAIRTDLWYRAPAARLAQANAAGGAPTWHYDFGWPSTFGALGAAHSIELRFVLDILDDPEAEPFYGSAPPRRIARLLQRAWHGLVRTCAVPDDLGWADHGAARTTMLVTDPPLATDGPLDEVLALWAPVIDRWRTGPAVKPTEAP